MPEAAVPQDRDRPPPAAAVKGRVGRRSEPVAHGRATDFERRQAGEQVAADVAGDLVLADFLLDQLERSEDRTLRAAGAKARRADRNRLAEIRQFRLGRIGRQHLARQQVRRVLANEGINAVQHDLAGVFAGLREDPLAFQIRGPAFLVEHGAELLLDEFRLALLDHQNGFLAVAEIEKVGLHKRIGDVEHMERNGGVAADIGQSEALQRRMTLL